MSLHYDVIGVWLRTALDSLRAARNAWKQAKKRILDNQDDVPIELLEIDFQRSMIAIISLSISVDAFYARLTQFNRVSTLKPGNMRQAPRYAQVAEQFRNSYKIDNKTFQSIRSALRQLYNMRDQAVHPSGKLTNAVLYPEIDRGVESRFELFRSKNVNIVAQDCINVILHLTENSSPKNDKVKDLGVIVNTEIKAIISIYSDIFTSKTAAT
ncbi:hypothetical protein LBMAG53_30650 [Planctomycetota bacterium]|nr:hypothetical protein LBMAG53_30650 [Planctomycetota bacterium]